MKTIPANRRQSPSLLPSSRVKCTGKTIVKKVTLTLENFAQTKESLLATVVEGSNPVQY